MRFWVARLVALAAAIALQGFAFTSPAGADDLCSHPEVINSAEVTYCRVETTQYRRNGQMEDAEIAVVTTGYYAKLDVMHSMNIYFLRTSDGKITPLHEFPQAGGFFALQRIHYQLLHEPGTAAGIVRKDPSDLFDRFIEVVSGQYCMVYRMKAPLVGEFLDCDGEGSPGGEIGYPGHIQPSKR